MCGFPWYLEEKKAANNRSSQRLNSLFANTISLDVVNGFWSSVSKFVCTRNYASSIADNKRHNESVGWSQGSIVHYFPMFENLAGAWSTGLTWLELVRNEKAAVNVVVGFITFLSHGKKIVSFFFCSTAWSSLIENLKMLIGSLRIWIPKTSRILSHFCLMDTTNDILVCFLNWSQFLYVMYW